MENILLSMQEQQYAGMTTLYNKSYFPWRVLLINMVKLLSRHVTIKTTIKYYQRKLLTSEHKLNIFCDKVQQDLCSLSLFSPVPYYPQILMSVSAVYTTATVQLHVQTL